MKRSSKAKSSKSAGDTSMTSYLVAVLDKDGRRLSSFQTPEQTMSTMNSLMRQTAKVELSESKKKDRLE